MLWVLLALVLAVAGSCAVLAFLMCHRQRLPDFADTQALKARGWGTRADEVAAFRDWLSERGPVPVHVDSDDELPLRGVLVPRKGARGTAVLFHGCRSACLADFAGPAQVLYDHGWQLILTDQRAHGASGGRWCSFGLWERFDVRAWCNYCELRFPGGHPLFLYGQGMGAAAALAAAELDLPGNVRGIIAEGAYTSPREVLERVLLRTPLPAGAALRMASAFTNYALGFSLLEPGAEAAAAGAGYPALIIHGAADSIVPADMARRLFSAYGAEKHLLMVEGAAHARCRSAAPERFDEALRMFLDTYET
ncbi:MAG: alpha/beta fold hydrolase [Oscillospiraceae bacterium]|nr:alpha/beta fold hydrolase [Oscillospiraceae bacterium]